VIRWLLLFALAVFVARALRRLGRRAPGSERPTSAAWDPHAVLGVPRGASPELITRRYHEELKRYHPDRVAGLGAELQQLAHRKTIELRRAYDELMRGPDPGSSAL
jgi:DnaJ-domain-containing protein 1